MTIPAILPVLSRISQIQARAGIVLGAPTVTRPGTSTTESFQSTYVAVGGAVAPPVADGSHIPPAEGTFATRLDQPTTTSHAHAHAHAHGVDSPLGLDTVPAGVPYASEFAAAADRHGVPAGLLAAVGWVESRYQPDAVSGAGAIGVMQLMPFVAEELGVDARDPAAAIDGAARVLQSHHDRFGSWDLALAAYHAGAGAVSRAGNAPPTPRTADYVRKVNERMHQP